MTTSKVPVVLQVWHGTRDTDPRVICTDKADGFMMQHSRKGMWGRGIYFAANAKYSHDYAHQTAEHKTLILASLVVGDQISLPSDSTLRHCPEKPDGDGRYHTVTGVTNGSQVYVVYENGRAYPEYLITYTD